MSQHPHNPPDDTCVNCLLEQVPTLRKQLAEKTAECERLTALGSWRIGAMCAREVVLFDRDEPVAEVLYFDRKGERSRQQKAIALIEALGAAAGRDADRRTALATKDLALAAAEARELRLRGALEEGLRITRETLSVAGLMVSVLVSGSCKALERTAVAALSAPTDTAALEMLCLRVAEAAWRSRDEAAPGFIGDAEPNARAIVKRLLSGGGA